MLQIKQEIIENVSKDTRAIAVLDDTKAFNIRHTAVMHNLSKLNVVVKTYKYVRNFLSNRTASIELGGMSLENIQLGNRGTPQGSVLSPPPLLCGYDRTPERLDKIHHVCG